MSRARCGALSDSDILTQGVIIDMKLSLPVIVFASTVTSEFVSTQIF